MWHGKISTAGPSPRGETTPWRQILNDLLRGKVESAAQEGKLTRAQQAKLLLAGKGDIKRFFDQVEERRAEFEKERKTFRPDLRHCDD